MTAFRRTAPLLVALAAAAVILTIVNDPPARNPDGTARGAREIPPPDGAARRNRLAREKSPYLLQHATNPVDWYPWGPEAFEKARREDKPVFLSIGYSTCHWCHVMAHESFEDDEVAAVLNRHFVSIKVDREERPEIDQIYMGVCVGMTGAGGWPLTVVMTPDQRPFFAGTYFPKRGRWGRPGLIEILERLAAAWKEDRDAVLSSAEEVARYVREQSHATPGEGLDEATLAEAQAALAARFDARHGGFGGAPKFPTPHTLSFLLRRWARTRNPQALEMAERTLETMAAGGIHDHLGGGFHRYATDAAWRVPHFEKMLYDQALLAIAYLEAYAATGKPHYARTARGVLDYVLRDLADPAGGFHSAEDADSEGLEGKFYLWRPEEIHTLLGPEDGALFCRRYGVTPEGNFDPPVGADGAPHGPARHSILHEAEPLAAVARAAGLAQEEAERRLSAARRTLLEARGARVRPHKDDKILADWNGLMIAALALAGRTLDAPAYTAAAERAADFCLARLRRADGRLLHRFRDGEAAIPAFLDDHAFLAWGLVELYETTFDPARLAAAVGLAEEMERLFRDDASGGFFLTGADAETLLARPREVHDGACPSGNSAAAAVLLRLAHLTGRVAWDDAARRLFAAFADAVERAPAAHTHLLTALDFAAGPVREVVIAGDPADPTTRQMVAAAREGFRPRQVTLLKPPGSAGEALARLAPFTTAQGSRGGRPAAYVCEGFACREPAADADALRALLADGLAPAGPPPSDR